jgi:hypothetical protein
MWTLLETARYLYHALRDDSPDEDRLAELVTELGRLRRDSERVGDDETLQAADALEKTARQALAEK